MNNTEEMKQIGMMRAVVYQVFADYYLKMNGRKSFAEEFPNAIDEYGKLNAEQIQLNRELLMQIYSEKGLDLKAEVEKAGQTWENKLSDYEEHELAKKADEFLIMLNLLQERKSKKTLF